MKECQKCLIKQPLDNFAWKNKTKGTKNTTCKSCHKVYRDEHYQNNKQHFVDKAKEWRIKERVRFYEWLQLQSCIDCENADFRVLEFDHIDNNKSYTIAEKIGNVTLETLKKEIDKCDIVCANCHKIRTANRGNQYKYLLADKT